MARASLPAGTPFGIWLRQRRKALDLTQEQLAAAIDVSLPTIVKIEAGQRRPSRQVAELLARPLLAQLRRLTRLPGRPAALRSGRGPGPQPPGRKRFCPGRAEGAALPLVEVIAYSLDSPPAEPLV